MILLLDVEQSAPEGSTFDRQLQELFTIGPHFSRGGGVMGVICPRVFFLVH